MMEIIISVCLGIGLAAAAGFRVFVPLTVLSVAAYFDVIPLNDHWSWIGSIATIVTFSIATVLEVFAYYIPWFDNLLDTISIPLASIAGIVLMVATVSDISPLLTWVLAIIAGGGTAASFKTAMSGGRAVSSVSTGGLANPLVATSEVATASILSVTSIFLPVLALLITILLIWILRKVYKKAFKRNSPS